MKKRKVNLYPKAGGKCLEFESIAEAAEFLHRDTCYMSTRYTKGLCVSDNYTLEKYVIDILGDQKKVRFRRRKKVISSADSVRTLLMAVNGQSGESQFRGGQRHRQ